MDDTRSRFTAICKELTGVDCAGLDDSTDLREHLSLDSLDAVELVMATEEEFGIAIADAEMDQPETGTLGGMIALIDRKRAAVAA